MHCISTSAFKPAICVHVDVAKVSFRHINVVFQAVNHYKDSLLALHARLQVLQNDNCDYTRAMDDQKNRLIVARNEKVHRL